MFETLLFIAVPTLFVLVGTVAALSFARDPEETEAGLTVAAAETATAAAQQAAAAPAELFKPRPQVLIEEKEELTFDELIASLEAHIRTEREAATAFISRPSTEALWVN